MLFNEVQVPFSFGFNFPGCLLIQKEDNTEIIKEALMRGFFLSQALIVSVRQQRTLGAQPRGEMSCRAGGDGVMTRWVGCPWELTAGGPGKSSTTGSLSCNQAHKRPNAWLIRQRPFHSISLNCSSNQKGKKMKSSLDFTNLL